jgi:beta-N-acetylglucosaminidase
MFQSTMRFMQENKFRFLKKNDLITFVQFLRSTNSIKMFFAYKRKNQKMKFNDIAFQMILNLTIMLREKKTSSKKKYFKNLTNQFAEFFIFKFFELTKKACLKFERIQKMQIKNELLKREKKFFFEMSFNREIAFFWDFIEKDLIRSKITSFMKICTMFHEAWQIFEF